MLKPLFLALTLASPAIFAMESIQVNNNADFELTLSQSNYNRIMVKGDKILDAAFPQSSMGIKPDEKDGSIYVALSSNQPFTLFLTTKAGHHFSVTVHGENALGKTVELVPKQTVAKPKQSTRGPSEEQTLVELIAHMQAHQSLPDFSVQKRQQVEQWKKGLKLVYRERWQGHDYFGEVIELYNGGRHPLRLDETWFNQANTRAMKLSQQNLAPKEKALLYRITEESHHG